MPSILVPSTSLEMGANHTMQPSPKELKWQGGESASHLPEVNRRALKKNECVNFKPFFVKTKLNLSMNVISLQTVVRHLAGPAHHLCVDNSPEEQFGGLVFPLRWFSNDILQSIQILGRQVLVLRRKDCPLDTLDQPLTKNSSWSRFHSQTISVNKVLLEHSHANLFIFANSSFFFFALRWQGKMWTNGNRNCMICSSQSARIEWNPVSDCLHDA